MKIKMFAATALVAITGAFGATTVAQADSPTPTKVTIKGNERRLLRLRQVLRQRLRVRPQGQGLRDDRQLAVAEARTTLIGTDTSAPNGPDGMWSIGNSGFKDGSFYAKVTKTDECGADLSKVIVR